MSNGSTASCEVAPLSEAEQPKVRKTRSRKKAEATAPEQERSLAIQASDPTTEAEVAPKPARSRRKKTAELAQDVASSQEASNGNTSSTPTSSETVVTPAKPKRTRRVGEPKPKRYPVGEQGTEQGVS